MARFKVRVAALSLASIWPPDRSAQLNPYAKAHYCFGSATTHISTVGSVGHKGMPAPN